MSRMKTWAALSIAAAGGMTMLASGAAAQANCDTYGRLAIQQQQENVRLKCGFGGPEWSGNLAEHKSWCGNVGPDQWKVQLQKRERALAGCASK